MAPAHADDGAAPHTTCRHVLRAAAGGAPAAKRKRGADDASSSAVKAKAAAKAVALSAIKPGTVVAGTVMRVTREQLTVMLRVRRASAAPNKRIHARVHLSDVFGPLERAAGERGADVAEAEAAPIPTTRGAARGRRPRSPRSAARAPRSRERGRGRRAIRSRRVAGDEPAPARARSRTSAPTCAWST